jgi:hypothetical protein
MLLRARIAEREEGSGIRSVFFFWCNEVQEWWGRLAAYDALVEVQTLSYRERKLLVSLWRTNYGKKIYGACSNAH